MYFVAVKWLVTKGLEAGGEFMIVRPVQKPNRKTEFEDNN